MRHARFFSLDWSTVVITMATIGAMVGACSTPPVDDTFGAGSGAANGQGGASTASSSDASTGTGSSSGNGGAAGGFMSSSSSGGSGGACVATVIKAEQVPVGMYLMADRSGSMQGQRWTYVTNAIKAFVDQPSSAGLGVGMQFFPIDTGTTCPTFCSTNADCGTCGPCSAIMPGFPSICAGSSSSCNVNDYSAPAVAIANLPGIAPVMKSILDMTSPSGGTPTSAALDGAIQYTKQWATMNQGAVGVVVFATDGEPSDCNTDFNYINGLAAAGLNGSPSVKTYVIGVGTNLMSLNGIAAAGGTGQAFLVDANANAQQEFLQAMNAIRQSALSCAYLIPPPPAGEMIDYNAINVQYTPSGGTPELIPRVSSPAACPASGKAWHYDNNMPPKQILLCPTTCDQISADTTGRIDILVGCAN